MNVPGLSLADRFWIAHRWAAFTLGTVSLGGVIVTSITGRTRPHYAQAYTFISNLVFLAHGLDKLAAVVDRWCRSEKSLHWTVLSYSWSGVLISQHILRHRPRKISFLFFTWLVSITNAAIFAYLTGFYRRNWQRTLLAPLWH